MHAIAPTAVSHSLCARPFTTTTQASDHTHCMSSPRVSPTTSTRPGRYASIPHRREPLRMKRGRAMWRYYAAACTCQRSSVSCAQG